LQGSRLVQWMDIAAVVSAQTHAGKICVMEIFVQAFAKKALAGKNYLISETYFTFVAVDEDTKTSAVPG
jgi:acyl-CoA hydrolase